MPPQELDVCCFGFAWRRSKRAGDSLSVRRGLVGNGLTVSRSCDASTRHRYLLCNLCLELKRAGEIVSVRRHLVRSRNASTRFRYLLFKLGDNRGERVKYSTCVTV